MSSLISNLKHQIDAFLAARWHSISPHSDLAYEDDLVLFDLGLCRGQILDAARGKPLLSWG